jgi:hypothetical protein
VREVLAFAMRNDRGKPPAATALAGLIGWATRTAGPHWQEKGHSGNALRWTIPFYVLPWKSLGAEFPTCVEIRGSGRAARVSVPKWIYGETRRYCQSKLGRRRERTSACMSSPQFMEFTYGGPWPPSSPRRLAALGRLAEMILVALVSD